MKTKLLLLCATGLLVALTRALAATLYVDAASTNAVPPFTTWASAAATIQDAVDAAVAGDEIIVTNGVYQTGARAVYGMSNRVAVTKPVTVQSVNGSEVTSIVGSGPHGDNAIRCAYLTNGAVLAGFTLTNGATQRTDEPEVNPVSTAGGGVWCESQGAVVTNCVLAGNTAFEGAGAYSGTLNNCTLTGNSAISTFFYASGGGTYGSTLNNCTLTGNWAEHGGAASLSTLNNCSVTGNAADVGGGAYDSTLNNCTLTGNYGNTGGGAAGSTLNNCTLTDNGGGDWGGDGGGAAWSTLNNCTLAGNGGRGGGGGASYSTLNNCTLTGNWADLGGGAYLSTLSNCTVTGNLALGDDGSGGGAYWSTLNNCIVYYNRSDNSFVDDANYSNGVLNYSCTTPDPGNGVGNITTAPLFVGTNGWSNLRLQSNSPCINAGNNAYVTSVTDLDGNPRIVNGTVDMGAFEWQVPAQFKAFARPGTNGLALSLTGESNRVYAVQASSNLTTWFPLGLFTNAQGAAPLVDVLSPRPPTRFYRAQPVP